MSRKEREKDAERQRTEVRKKGRARIYNTRFWSAGVLHRGQWDGRTDGESCAAAAIRHASASEEEASRVRFVRAEEYR